MPARCPSSSAGPVTTAPAPDDRSASYMTDTITTTTTTTTTGNTPFSPPPASSPCRLHPRTNAFQRLVCDLCRVLGPSSGLDSADVDPLVLQRLMEAYTSQASDWERFAWGDASRAYTRNLVDRGNGKSNLLILVWTPGKSSPIHDHARAHCVMKVLQGTLKETLYDWPNSEAIEHGRRSPLREKRVTVYPENGVTYMSDKLGLHKISNPDSEKVAISLHLYTPPNAATFGCHLFDESTGKASYSKQCNFYTIAGRRIVNTA